MFWLSFGAVAMVSTTVEPETLTPLIDFATHEPPRDGWYSSVKSPVAGVEPVSSASLYVSVTLVPPAFVAMLERVGAARSITIVRVADQPETPVFESVLF